MKIVAAFVTLSIPTLAAAQAVTLVDLKRAIKAGETAVVVNQSGETLTGRVEQISADEFTMTVGDRRPDGAIVYGPSGRKTLAAPEIAEVRRSDAPSDLLYVGNIGRLLPKDKTLIVIRSDGKRVTGRVADSSHVSVVLMAKAADGSWSDRQEIPASMIRRVQGPHNLWNGPLIGFAVGGLPYVFAGYPEGILIGGGIGALIGLGIDVAIPAHRYFNASRHAQTVSVSPVVGPQRGAAFVTVRF